MIVSNITGIDLRRALALHGAVWFRNCPLDAHGFFALIRPLASQLITLNNYDRVPHPELPEVQSVTGGTQALNFHMEMGHVPGQPHFLALWCERAPVQGGQTLLLDGIKLWEALSNPTRQMFSAQRLRSVMRVPKAWWTAHAGGDRLEDAQRALSAYSDVTLTLEGDGTLTIDWLRFAASASCFAANVFKNVIPGLRMTFEDGTEIPEQVIAELDAAAARLGEPITWSNGDVVLFDNTRYFHGRRAVVDAQERKLHMLQGYLS